MLGHSSLFLSMLSLSCPSRESSDSELTPQPLLSLVIDTVCLLCPHVLGLPAPGFSTLPSLFCVLAIPRSFAFPGLKLLFHEFFLDRGNSDTAFPYSLSIWLFLHWFVCFCCFTWLTLSFHLKDKLDLNKYFTFVVVFACSSQVLL